MITDVEVLAESHMIANRRSDREGGVRKRFFFLFLFFSEKTLSNGPRGGRIRTFNLDDVFDGCNRERARRMLMRFGRHEIAATNVHANPVKICFDGRILKRCGV